MRDTRVKASWTEYSWLDFEWIAQYMVTLDRVGVGRGYIQDKAQAIPSNSGGKRPQSKDSECKHVG